MAKIRFYERDGKRVGLWFFCPGCKDAHRMDFAGEHPGPKWQFNGSEEAPILAPSLRVFTGGYKKTDGTAVPERTLCHLFVGGDVSVQPNGVPTGTHPGMLKFLDDSTGHELRGLHPLPDFPEDYETY